MFWDPPVSQALGPAQSSAQQGGQGIYGYLMTLPGYFSRLVGWSSELSEKCRDDLPSRVNIGPWPLDGHWVRLVGRIQGTEPFIRWSLSPFL